MNRIADSENDFKEILKQWYFGQIEEEKGYIHQEKEWISTLNRFREKYSDNWRIVEGCRELIFYHTREIREEAQEIERIRKAIAELG